ncbi:MAG: hypothetical protein KBC35_04535 [Candidatus Pacebacteria bacterium]|jgi:hypothetical protein|nr:hypothetical protein [Candidatus Paceibacterota bacterium]
MKTIVNSGRVWIPALSEEHLRERARKIRPIIRFAEGPKGYFQARFGFPCYIWSRDIHLKSYLSKPEYYQRAAGLKPLHEIETYHLFSTPLTFCPSVAEVLAAIPEKYIPAAVAFEIVELLEDKEASNAGYHVAKTCLYKKAT